MTEQINSIFYQKPKAEGHVSPGRPVGVKDGEAKKREQLQMRCGTEFKQALKAFCEKHDKSMSDVAEAAIIHVINHPHILDHVQSLEFPSRLEGVSQTPDQSETTDDS